MISTIALKFSESSYLYIYIYITLAQREYNISPVQEQHEMNRYRNIPKGKTPPGMGVGERKE